jgi:hypothetical protein
MKRENLNGDICHEVKLFTDKERQMIVDALLFFGCADITTSCKPKYREKMIALAEKVGADPSNKIKLFKGGRYEDEELANRIEDGFNIKKDCY